MCEQTANLGGITAAPSYVDALLFSINAQSNDDAQSEADVPDREQQLVEIRDSQSNPRYAPKEIAGGCGND